MSTVRVVAGLALVLLAVATVQAQDAAVAADAKSLYTKYAGKMSWFPGMNYIR
jgi:hypothetical protein